MIRRRPAQLDDADWLRERYEVYGDTTIGLELGVNRKTVTQARLRLGIPTHPAGRRATTARPLPTRRVELDQTEQAIVTAYRQAQERRMPATVDQVAKQIVAMHEARVHNDDRAYGAAIIDAIAALAVLDSHRRKLRRAA